AQSPPCRAPRRRLRGLRRGQPGLVDPPAHGVARRGRPADRGRAGGCTRHALPDVL
ncbi:MAG: hypothetical protein AVDCRST_MAG50-573, partial [uncultured Acidimicrobiales bacterium]